MKKHYNSKLPRAHGEVEADERDGAHLPEGVLAERGAHGRVELRLLAVVTSGRRAEAFRGHQGVRVVFALVESEV